MMKKGSTSRDVLTKSHHSSYVSQSGLAAVLKSVKENGLPSGISRSTIKRKRDQALPEDLFVTETVGPAKEEVCIVHPIRLLQFMIQTIPAVEQLMEAILRDSDGEVSFAVYSDEVLPGNQLKPRNDRKLVSFYWSIVQAGRALGAEDAWWHLCTLRANVARALPAGWSGLFKLVVQAFFKPPFDASQGVVLQVRGEPMLMKGKIGLVIGDEAALQGCWSFKGASGQIPCFLCQNVTLHRLDIAVHDMSNSLCSHCCTDLSKIRWHTNESMFDAINHVRASSLAMNRQQFVKCQQALGINYEPDGALFWDKLGDYFEGGPITVTQWDYMHCYFVNGIFNSEAGYLLEVLKDVCPPKTVHAFLQKLTWPKRWSSSSTTGKNCLAKFVADGSEVKCSASEGLSVFPAFRLFLLQNVQDGISDQVDKAKTSFLALCQVLDLLSSQVYTKEVLQSSIVLHLQCRLAAYGHSRFQPKCHYSIHMPFFVGTGRRLQACWVHERKHKELKRFSTDSSNANVSRGWERSLLKQVVLSQCNSLSEFTFDRSPRLGASKPGSPELVAHVRSVLELGVFAPANVLIAEHAFLDGEAQVWAKDIVLLVGQDGNEQVGEVWYFMSCNAHTLVCWCPFDALGNNKFQRREHPCLEPMKSIKRALIFCEEEAGRILVAP